MEIKVGEFTVKYFDNEIEVFDFVGNLVHDKRANTESWYDYDHNNNCIHATNNHGYERWTDFNSDGEKIHTRYSDHKEFWYHDGHRISKTNFRELYDTVHVYVLKK